MIPDAFTNLYILNCTNTDLGVSGINNYQMVSWYPPGAQMPQQSLTGPQFIQFLAGDGAEDDSGTIYLNVGSGSETQFLLYGGSVPNGAHYIDCRNFVLPAQPTMNLVFGLVANGMWPMTLDGVSNISWYPFQYLSLGALATNGTDPFGPYARKVLAIVDLNQLYSSANATQISTAIGSGSLTAAQQEDLWLQVSAFAQAAPSVLTFSLSDLVFADSNPSQTSQDLALNTQVTVDKSGTSTSEYSITNNYENSFTLTADTVWSFGAEIEVETPIPFLPGATLSTSFEAGSSQATANTNGQTLEFRETITLSGPGTYKITGFMNIDDNFTTAFTATLTVTGTFLTLPINGMVLTALAAAQGGWTIPQAQVTINAASISAQVGGTLTGNFAYQGVFTETQIS